uniref:receptor protein-tyrosine kinase n=1 Tax=Anolis carolinensis TaxID=28377 RepID=H9GBH3_ANOCA
MRFVFSLFLNWLLLLFLVLAVAPFWTRTVKHTLDRGQIDMGSVPVGNTVKFRCQASGRPLPSITWLKNGKRITEPDLRPQHWTLMITNVTFSDGGNYTCLVRNRYGARCHTYYLTVENFALHRPTLEVGFPANQIVVVGSDAEFTCKADSPRPISMQWLKQNEVNGKKYGPDGLPYITTLKVAFHLQTTNETFDVLRLHNVTSEDAGEYICLAGNPIGISFRSAWLTVLPGTSGWCL